MAKNVHSAKTNVIVILPVTLAPPGNTGMIPIKLLIKMKKNTVNR